MEYAQIETPLVASDARPSFVPADFDRDVRPFLAHELFGSALASTSVELRWTHAEPGQEVKPRSDSNPALLVILSGSAKLTGKVRRVVEQGDVVTLPPDEEYGFTAVGSHGLRALRVSFRERRETQARDVTTLEGLLETNELRTHLILNNPFFLLWRDARIDGKATRRMMRECLRLFADALQTFMFTRQAMDRDTEYASLFGEPVDASGCGETAEVHERPPITIDPVLRATSSWFVHQILTLDSSGKAVVNLVLETARHYLRLLTSAAQTGRRPSDATRPGATEQVNPWVRVLELENPDQHAYRRLHAVLEATWDMLDAMTTRIASLVVCETAE